MQRTQHDLVLLNIFIFNSQNVVRAFQRSCKLGFFVKIDATVAKNTQKRIPTRHVK